MARAALVTGAASGIGKAAANRLAADGFSLMLVDRDEERLSDAAEFVASSGAKVRTSVTNVGDEAGAEEAVAKARGELGGLDTLVNAAGMALVGTVLDTTLEQWEMVFGTNVRSIFLFSKAAIPDLRQGSHPSIVNVASEAGLVGFASYAAYSASKAAVVNLTRSMALDHASEGIRINCVCPGSIETPLLQRFYEDQPDPAEARRLDEVDHPLGIGQPEDVAEAIAFLAGSGSRYITGHALAVDGGYTAK